MGPEILCMSVIISIIFRYEGELFSVPTPRYGLAARILEQLTGQICERIVKFDSFCRHLLWQGGP